MRKAVLGWLGWVALVIVISAVISPWIYQLTDQLLQADFPFRRVFNRVVMITALILCWPLACYWGVKSWREIGLVDVRWLHKIGRGWLFGILTMGFLWLIELTVGARELTGAVSWGRIIGIVASACLIGFIEEILFRGFFFQAVKPLVGKNLSIWGVWMGVFFASAHFLKAADFLMPVNWKSGWWMWSHLYLSDGSMNTVQGVSSKWVSLVLVGWLLCLVVYKSGSVWEAMGWHAGWVMVIKFSSQLSQNRPHTNRFWFGSELFTGFWGLALLIGLCVYLGWRKSDECLDQRSIRSILSCR